MTEEQRAIFRFWWDAGSQPGPWVGFDEGDDE